MGHGKKLKPSLAPGSLSCPPHFVHDQIELGGAGRGTTNREAWNCVTSPGKTKLFKKKRKNEVQFKNVHIIPSSLIHNYWGVSEQDIAEG